jgi:hypothetical protein
MCRQIKAAAEAEAAAAAAEAAAAIGTSVYPLLQGQQLGLADNFASDRHEQRERKVAKTEHTAPLH